MQFHLHNKIKSCVTYLVPVLSLPLGTRLQTALLCAVWPQRGATAMRGRAVHQALPHAFTTATKALRKTHGFKDGVCFSLRIGIKSNLLIDTSVQ